MNVDENGIVRVGINFDSPATERRRAREAAERETTDSPIAPTFDRDRALVLIDRRIRAWERESVKRTTDERGDSGFVAVPEITMLRIVGRDRFTAAVLDLMRDYAGEDE